ncbi:hypothetical protein F5884DRAFT_903578 [Xylogone sp. PMI_703]|nr:hypothetical protein F5884DRAFT_903578 [Xylogone sp. PMI_703]
MVDNDKDQPRDSLTENATTNSLIDEGGHAAGSGVKMTSIRLRLHKLTLQTLKDLEIAYKLDPVEPDYVLINKYILSVELLFLQSHTECTRKSSVKDLKRIPQLCSATTTYRGSGIEVIEYDDWYLEGRIQGITKIPENLTTAQVLESLGWDDHEVEDGFFEIKCPLKSDQIKQILNHNIEIYEDDSVRSQRGPSLPRHPYEVEDEEIRVSHGRIDSPLRRTLSPDPINSFDPGRSTHKDGSPQRFEEREYFNYPGSQSKEGKSLKFDVNLLSLASDIKDSQANKISRPSKPLNIDKPDIVSIETSRRYTEDSDEETVVLTTTLKSLSSQPGHLRWVHLQEQDMSFESLKQLLLTAGLNSDDALIARQLLQKIQDEGGDKPFVHGHYLEPEVRRCDAHDVEDDTKPHRTCTFVCFPYFSLQNSPPLSSTKITHTHAARGLLQTLYYLESTKIRDLEQVVRKLRPPRGDETIYVSQMWAIVLGSDTLITYSAATLGMMRGDKIQIMKPITTIRTGPSTFRVTDPFERLFFFSLDQCKTWFELTNIIHDQCLHSYGYSIDECDLFLKDDQKLKAPSWSKAIEAAKSPIVDIFVRFKDARELEEDEIERAAAERDRRRYWAEDTANGRDSPLPTARRAIRSRDTLDSYAETQRRWRRTLEADSEAPGGPRETATMPTKRAEKGGQYVETGYHNLSQRPSRRETMDRESTTLIIRPREWSHSLNQSRARPRESSPSDRIIRQEYIPRQRENVNRVPRTGTGDTYNRGAMREIAVRERGLSSSAEMTRRRERDSSVASVTRQRPGPRYQPGGIVVNEPKRNEKANENVPSFYYTVEKKKDPTIPSVQIREAESETPFPQHQSSFSGGRSSRNTFNRRSSAEVSHGETGGKEASPHSSEDPVKGSKSPKSTDGRPRSSSSTRVLPIFKPSVSPILMWPVIRANPSPHPNDSATNGKTAQQSANDSSIVDILDRVNEHFLADDYYEHNHLYLEMGQATRQESIFKSIEVEQPLKTEPILNTKSVPTQADSTAPIEITEPSVQHGRRQNLHPTLLRPADSEKDKILTQFYEISSELLDSFVPTNYPNPVVGRYYGAMRKIIEMLVESHSLYFVKEGKNSPERTAFEHLRQVHFKSENGAFETPSTSELERLVKRVDRRSVERRAEEQLRVLKRCCQHLLNLQMESREIRDGVSTDDKVHQARYRLPKALVTSFQRLVMLLIYTAHVLDVIVKNSEGWLSTHWESENDHEYMKAYDHMIFLGSGAEVNMEQGKLDLLQMIRLQDYTKSVSYEAVGPEYILSMVMHNLQGGINCKDLIDVYKEWAERLEYQVSLRPRKRLLRDFQQLFEEIKALSNTLDDQSTILENFRRCLVPNSFRTTTETRVSMYSIEKTLLSKTATMNTRLYEDYQEINHKVERLVSQTKTSIEILDDDHGKAIFVFTVVTLIFLPLSFVASLLGMNTVDIRNQNTTQWLFWAIALPITAVVVALALLVAYRYDEMREWMDKKTKKELRQ